jgi:hypothetical protein
MLLDRVDGHGATSAERLYLPTELVIRSTTAPVGMRTEERNRLTKDQA